LYGLLAMYRADQFDGSSTLTTLWLKVL